MLKGKRLILTWALPTWASKDRNLKQLLAKSDGLVKILVANRVEGWLIGRPDVSNDYDDDDDDVISAEMFEEDRRPWFLGAVGENCLGERVLGRCQGCFCEDVSRNLMSTVPPMAQHTQT